MDRLQVQEFMLSFLRDPLREIEEPYFFLDEVRRAPPPPPRLPGLTPFLYQPVPWCKAGAHLLSSPHLFPDSSSPSCSPRRTAYGTRS